MSKIEKMSVMGIRSFGPEDGDRQVIQFLTPLTLILGPNGTGKTTIIECLKYITTGDMPPNTKGGAFVHDPKIAQEMVVRAQVRLQLRDVTGKLLQVQRSMEVTQKAKKMEMRTLDSVITRLAPDGQKVSVNSKCLDFDREMVTALGVPKAVLDNVIFCHQEDSCWPLGEGKALKDKFDAIFASTRYTKVLDTIRKLKLEQDGEIKLFKEEIKYLKQNKDQASQLEGDLAELQAKSAASEESVKKIREQLQPLQDRLLKINDQHSDIYKVQTKIEKLKSEKGQLEKAIKDLHDNIENEFQGSVEELEELLSDFANKVQNQKDILTQFEDRQENVTKNMEKLNKEKSLLLVEVGKLGQEADTHGDNIRKRDALLRQLAVEYGFEGFSQGAITEDRCQVFFNEIQQKLDDISTEMKKVKSDFEAKEKSLQQQADEVRDKKTQREQMQRHKRDQMNKNKSEIHQIKEKLSRMEASAGRRDHVTQDLKRTEHELADAEKAINLEELKREIAQLERERRQLEAQMNELNTEMSILHLQSSIRAQLDMLKKEKTTKEDGIRRMKAKHEESLIHLFGAVPATNIRGRVEGYISQQSDCTKKCSAELQKAKTLLSQKETERNLLTAQIKEKEEEAKDLEDRIFSVCGSQDFEEEFQTIQQKLSETQDQRGSLTGAQHFLKKYVKDLEKENPCCPLCHREFDTDQEVRELVLELEKKLRMVPSKLEKAEEELVEQRSRYDSITQLKPIKERLAAICENDLPNMKTKLQTINEEIQRQKDIVEEKRNELAVMERDEGVAKEIQPDIVLMDRSQGELRELEKKITTQSALLTGGDADRTLEMVVREKEDIQLKLDTVTRKLDHLRQKQTVHTDHVQSLRTKINQLQAEKLRIDAELQERTKLEERQAQLISDNQEYETDIARAKEELQPLESEVRRLGKEKEEVTSAKETAMEQGKDAMEEVRNKGNAVKIINQSIKSYNSSGKLEKLEKCKERQKQIAASQSKLEQDQDEVTANINRLRKDLATQQIRERELADNLQLRRMQNNVTDLAKQIAHHQETLGGLDPTSLERERQQLSKKEEDLKRELHRVSGRQQGFVDEIKKTERDLKSDMFRDADQKYRFKMIDLRTTELANGDLQKYYKAMDRAIMNYHAQKMDEINKIIFDLWRNTYRGRDIETIEIRSDEDDAGIVKARRVYNYRVVMLKGGTALDMRGRCSAGQKVLASLIIRLALAETFCMNCGVFALDEPTTNLDRENIESLADALVRIIETRSQQRNFQLVIITHDEDFVEQLGRANYADHFIRVFKDEKGYSRLERKKIQDLHSA